MTKGSKASGSSQALPNEASSLGLRIETTAVINQITIGCHKDVISFTSLDFTGPDNVVVTDMVKKERDVLMTIDLPVPDEKFPPIQVKGKLNAHSISKTCDAPKMANIQFSSGQVAQLASYIRGEQPIKLVFLEVEPDLPLDNSPQTKMEFSGPEAGDAN